MNHVPDELLSALIDGEAPPSPEAAHLEECVECQERLDQLQGVVALVGAPVTVPAGHMREAAVAAALVETTGAAPAIRRLMTRRDRAAQSQATRRISNLSAAAALVVALGVGGWLLSQVGRDGGDDAGGTTALKAEQSQNDSAGAAADNATNEMFSTAPAGGEAAGGGGGGFFDAGDIGAFTDTAAIEAEYRQYESQPSDNAVGQPPCPRADRQTPVWHASLTYNGEAAYARVRWVSQSEQILEVLRRTDCGLLASRALAPSTPR